MQKDLPIPWLTVNFYLASSKIVVNGKHARDFISLLRSNLIEIDRSLTRYINNLVMEAPLPEQSESVKDSKGRSSRNKTQKKLSAYNNKFIARKERTRILKGINISKTLPHKPMSPLQGLYIPYLI